MEPSERTLVVYYSRSGRTKEVGIELADLLKADVEPIHDRYPRGGIFGYLRSGFEAVFGRVPAILDTRLDPSKYDLVILGAPVWNASIASPMRAYVAAHAKQLPRVAFFCTHGGSGSARALRQLETLTGKSPIASLILRASEIDHAAPKLRSFVDATRGKVSSARPAPMSRPHGGMPGTAPAS